MVRTLAPVVGLRRWSRAFSGAVALLAGGTVPGVWLVMTGWRPELAVDRQGIPTTPDVACQSVALALVPPSPVRGPD